jgi:hypothetical protein
LENAVTRRECWLISAALLDAYIARHRKAPPSKIVIDADATDDETHGNQQLSFFHGYYDYQCDLPLAAVYDGCDDILLPYIISSPKNQRLVRMAEARAIHAKVAEKVQVSGELRVRGRQVRPSAPRHREGRSHQPGREPTPCVKQYQRR